MSRMTSFWRNLLRRDRVERDLNDELRATFELLVDEKICSGVTPGEARRAARLELGTVESLKEHVRDAQAGAFVERLVRDVRYCLRALLKNPGTSLIIVITFALGSAGVTTMFALVSAILLQPLPYPQPERLVALKHAAPGLGLAEAGLSRGTYFHYRRHSRSFETIAVYTETVLNLARPDTVTERVTVALAGPELFEVLGVRPVLGRLFTQEDGRPGFMDTTWNIPVVVSHALWQSHYGGDPGIIGRTITLNERTRHIVGVLPASSTFPRPETQIWMLSMPTDSTQGFANSLDYSAVARLRPGVSPAMAAADLERILPAIEGVYTDATAARIAEVQLAPIVVPLKEEVVGSTGTLLLLLFGGMTFLLLVACANVANLSLLRAEHRDREIAVRTALGARPGDLIRLFVSEAAVFSIAGAALGLLVAHVALHSIVAFTPVRLPRLAEVELDGWVMAFTCGLAALATLLFGGLSFLQQSVVSSTAIRLKPSGGNSRGQVRLRDALVAVQVGLALTLLVGSALMVQSFRSLTHVDPGFDPAGLLTVEIGLPGRKANEHQRIYGALLERVRALPGVTSAAAGSSLPLDGAPYAYPMAVGVPPRPTELPVAMKFVMPGYFEAMRTPIVEGAGFALDERMDAPNPVVVSAALARRVFPGESAIGQEVLRLESDGSQVEMFDFVTKAIRRAPSWTIVGVAADVRETSLRAEPAEMVYVPVRDPAVERSIVPTNMTLVIRSNPPPASLQNAVRNTVRDLDPTLSVARVRTMEAIVTSSIASERFLAGLLLVAAAASLFLGAMGVYGVAAHAVRRREHEIGVRVSLGARPGQLVGMVLRESVAFVLIGTALGLATGLVAARALGAFLYDVSATDPATLAVVTTLLIAVALVASLLPARRAVRLDPVVALRSSD